MSCKQHEIYFCGSIRGGRQDVQLYARIVQVLRQYGRVLTEFVADPNVTDMGPDEGELCFDRDIHDRDMVLMSQCDCVVAECTQVSMGVGYELGRAMALNKRILVLYRPQSNKRLSAMIRGLPPSEHVRVVDYSPDELESILQDFFASRTTQPTPIDK